MFPRFFLLLLLVKLASSQLGNFTTNGLISVEGTAEITPDGSFRAINGAVTKSGHVFYFAPLPFKNSTNGSVSSFSTNFIYATHSEYASYGGHGMAFVISPSNMLSGSLPFEYFGLFNYNEIGLASNHIFAVELDTLLQPEFEDIDSNHVGIDINGLKSIESAPAAYFSDENGGFNNMSLLSSDPMQISIEYDGVAKQLNVTLFPINKQKPRVPLLSSAIDLSSTFLDHMYVGFSSCTAAHASSHYVLGWSFSIGGKAQALDTSRLPALPWKEKSKKMPKRLVTIGLPLIATVCVLLGISCTMFILRKKLVRSAQEVEDWELEYGPHRIAYEDLNVATGGFTDKQLLGSGGFGRVYRGILPITKTPVAVKRISHESHQGMKEFIAEVVSLGRLRHRNLVPLRGYCRYKGELLLVYDLMPRGSLDKFIYDQPKSSLNWGQRFRIIKGVASGLLYLHEEWDQVVLHRDIKASNVLLDSELQEDWEISVLRDCINMEPTFKQPTLQLFMMLHLLAGTLGYLAPELARTGKATTSTDVFAFGIFILEVACGRRPIEWRAPTQELLLVDWVLDCWRKGVILDSADAKLVDGYPLEEMELVLKLGLLCSHPLSKRRPSMRLVMQFLDGDVPLPKLSPDGFTLSVSELEHVNGSDGDIKPDHSLIMESSALSGGR